MNDFQGKLLDELLSALRTDGLLRHQFDEEPRSGEGAMLGAEYRASAMSPTAPGH